jgi:hypothetical protein
VAFVASGPFGLAQRTARRGATAEAAVPPVGVSRGARGPTTDRVEPGFQTVFLSAPGAGPVAVRNLARVLLISRAVPSE